LLPQESIYIFWVKSCFLDGADLDQEITSVESQIVVQDDDGALLLKSPYLFVDLLIIVTKQLSVKRVVD